MQTWYAQRAGQQYGPFDDTALVELVRQGQIGEDDWLTSDFGTHWQPARSVAGLFPHARAGVIPPAPVFQPIPQAVPVAPVAGPPGYVAPVAAIPVQPLAPAPAAPVAAMPAPAFAAAPAPYGAAPSYGAPVAAAPYVAPAAAVADERARRFTTGDGIRWTVLLLMMLLALLFWYAWLHPTAG